MNEPKEPWEEASEIRGYVWCRTCFRPIDLTSMNPELIQPVSHGDRLLGAQWDFTVPCLACIGQGRGQVKHQYSYEDVRQLENWKDAENRINTRLDSIETRFNDPHFKADIAKALMEILQTQVQPEAPSKTDPTKKTFMGLA